MITEEQEALTKLWNRYNKTGKTECRDELIVQYLYLVKVIAGRMAYGLPAHVKLDDLYSSGVTGLIRAVEKFDSSKNNKFETYAILLIKGAIIDEMRELDWIPRSIHQKANRIAEAQVTLQQRLGRDPTDDELSTHLGITEEEFETWLHRVRPAILIPLNADTTVQDEENVPLSERIADVKAETSYEAADRREFQTFLAEAISALPDQERRVLTLYYYEDLMLKEIGKILGVSESRVSQIHTKALIKLRSKLAAVRAE